MFFYKQTINLATLSLFLLIHPTLNGLATRLDIRSQSENGARDLAGLTQHIHVPLYGYHGTITITPHYSRSYNSNSITRTFFGCDTDRENTITIKGSNIAGRDSNHDWIAENFYLSDSFASTLSFQPRIEQSITDFNLYFGFNNFYEGLFVRIHAPVVWTKWDLHMHEKVTTAGTTNGWLNTPPFTAVNTSKLLGSFTEYACQELVPTPIYSASAGGIRTAYPLNSAKMCLCPTKKTALSDIQTDIGWDYVRNTYHVGIFGRIVAPTGTRPQGKYLFEPTIGNGKHWELGGGITSHIQLWQDSVRKHTLGLYMNANMAHLCTTRQKRVFDLKGYGPLSRYLLVKKIHSPVATLTVSPAANLTYRTVKVSAAVQTDIVAMLSYLREFITCDFGYNFWARSCEKINCIPECSTSCSLDLAAELDTRQWRIIHGNETIHSLGSTSPVLLTEADIDYANARTYGVSHKFFINVAYNWLDNGTWVPYIGAGAEVEFSKHDSYKSADCASICCQNSAISQWSVWTKGGISF